jgi:hypothetical protein
MPAVFIIYLLFVLVFLVYSAAGIYHLWRFGYSGDLSKAVIYIYSLVSIVIIILSLVFLSLNWIQG